MKNKTKTLYPLVSLALVSVLVGKSAAQDESQYPTLNLNINSQSETSGSVPSASLDVTLEADNFTERNVERNAFAKTFWTRVQSVFSKNGATLSTGTADTSAIRSTVSVSAWPEGKSFLEAGSVPPAWSNLDLGVKGVTDEFRDFDDRWKDLSTEEKAEEANAFGFLRFHDKKGGMDFRTAVLCSALPYAADQKKSLKLPPEIAAVQKEVCKDSKAKIFQLTYSINDWGTTDGKPPRNATDGSALTASAVLRSEAFAGEFVSFRAPFEKICGATALADARARTSLVNGGWIDSKLAPGVPGVEIALSTAMESCSATVRDKLVPLLAESLKFHAEQGRFVADNAWLNTQLRVLANDRKDEWLNGSEITGQVLKDLATDFSAAAGYTNNPIVTARDLNVGAVMNALSSNEAEELTNASLIAKFFLVDNAIKQTSPWYKELEKLPAAEREKYRSRLIKALTTRCTTKIDISCLADSLGHFDGLQQTPLVKITSDSKVVLKKFGLAAP